jgi:toxin HigB-1
MVSASLKKLHGVSLRVTLIQYMIKSFAHKGLEAYFTSGTKAGIQAVHANRLRLQLAKLDSASVPEDMNLPGWRLHPLKGSMKEHWAVWVDQSWRMTFKFEGGHAFVVNYQDYH